MVKNSTKKKNIKNLKKIFIERMYSFFLLLLVESILLEVDRIIMNDKDFYLMKIETQNY